MQPGEDQGHDGGREAGLGEQPRPAGPRAVDAAAPEALQEERGVQPGREGARESEARVREGADEQQVEHHVRDHRDHRDAHRGAHLLAGVEPGRQHLDGHERHEPRSVGGEAERRHPHRVRPELAVLEYGGDHRRREEREAEGGGQRDHQDEPQGPVEGRLEAVRIVLRMAGGEGRERHGREGDPEYPERELHEPVRVVQPRDAAGGEIRCELGVDEQVHLGDGHPQHRGDDEPDDAAHAFVGAPQPRPDEHPDAPQERELERELRRAAGQHPPRECGDRLLEPRREDDGGRDERGVEQARGDRGDPETAPGVEDPAGERGQGDEQEVGKGEAQQRARECGLVRLPGEAGGEYVDQDWRGEDPRRGDREHYGAQGPRHVADEVPRLLLAP